MDHLEIEITKREAGKRIDLAMMEFAPLKTSRTVVQTLILSGKITVNSKKIKSSYKLKIGDTVEAIFPPPDLPQIIPENIPLKILYEDEYMVVVNKQPGLVTHPTIKKTTGTLVNALMWHFNGKNFPYIVHRLDKDTSGAIVVAKNPDIQRILSEQFKERKTYKLYLAIVDGIPSQKSGEIEAPIARNPQIRTRMDVLSWGRQARTLYKSLKTFGTATLLAVRIMTGRTHQIRVHMNYMGNPVLGDKIYGKKFKVQLKCERQMLHSAVLEINHPVTQERMRFIAPLPDDFKYVLRELVKYQEGKNVQ